MLVSQMLSEAPKKEVKLKDPLCPRCKLRLRTIAAVSGRIADYCRECKRDYSNKAREKAAIKRKMESNYDF